jgi:hypothetical protein
MRSKSYTEMNSLSTKFVEQVAEEYGKPDNFVESADGTFSGLPNVDSDPGANAILTRLERDLAELVAEERKTNGNGNGASTHDDD